MARSALAPTTRQRRKEEAPVEVDLDAGARVLARCAVENALAELGLDIRSATEDGLGTTE